MKQEIIVIPEFTSEDYKNTSAPYEWLYQYKDDKFMLRQMCEKMKEQAGAVGVKAFWLFGRHIAKVKPQKMG